MPENDPSKTPPVDVAAITKQVTEAVTAAFAPQIAEIAKNQKIFGDTFEVELKKLKPVEGDKKLDPKAGDGKAPVEPVTPDSVLKLVADGVAAALKARDEEAAKATQSKAARQAIVDKVVKEKLGGNAKYAELLAGDDEATIAAHAEKLALEFKALKPDFGGAGKDGGTPPNGQSRSPVPVGNLSPGTAKVATAIEAELAALK